MVDFGLRLRKLRTDYGMTQLELAQKLGLTKSVISAYETDLRMPSYDVLVNIANIFKVSTDYLLGVNISKTLDLSGLSVEEINAVTLIVNSFKRKIPAEK